MTRWSAAWSARAARASVLAAFLAVCLAVAQCGGGTPPTRPTPPPTSTTPPGDPTPPTPPIPTPPSAPHVFVGAGDIAMCRGNEPPAMATGRLVSSIGGTVFTLGDNVYEHGTEREFKDCYERTWGAVKSYTFPVLGNHEYDAPANPLNYFDYFGFNAGTRGQGWYSHELGGWHAIALNSNVDVRATSPQMQWLKADLAVYKNKCTIAYWHHPLFTSGQNGPQTFMREVWRFLQGEGVDVVLTGHDHLYERFAPQDADGRADPQRGMVEFVVGTGGALLYDFITMAPNSLKRIKAFGVLKLTLRTDAYDFAFMQVGGAIGDSGSGVCH